MKIRRILAVIATSLCVAWGVSSPATAQDDARPVVGIAQMEDLTGGGNADNFVAMIETAIIGSGKFRIIERARLSTLLEEQGLALGGTTTTNAPGQVGGFEGVDYLVYGTISSISATNRSDFGGSLLRGMLGGSNSNQQECYKTRVRMEADIRITDTETGEVRYAKRISEEQDSATVCGGGAQIDSSALLRSTADQIATGLVTAIFPIQVAAIQGDGTVILNFGEGAVRPGDFLMIYGEATEIPDPSGTGMIRIDGEQQGAIQVTDAQTGFSRAIQVTQFTVPLAVGAIARPVDEDVVKALQKAQRRRR
jgi:hypothetical protein